MKKQNNTSMAHSAKPHKKRPFRLLALLAMLCYGTLAWAQARGEWNGETNGTFTISNDMTIESQVTIGNTDVLTLQIKKDVTISRDNTQGILMFWVKPGGTLNIIGEAKPDGGFYKATFVGGSTVTLDHPTDYQAFEGDYVTTVANKRGIMWNNLGNVTIKHARITGFQVRDGNGTGSRGVINLVWDDSENTSHVSKGFMLMEDVEIDHCWGGPAIEDGSGVGSGRIINLQAGNWDATLKNVELHHCFSCEHPHNSAGIHHFGGIIRTEGGLTGTLTIDGCRFYNNKYKYWKKNGCRLIGQGGVINWRAAGAEASDTELIIKDSKFYNNQAAEGGAIATNAKIKMSNDVKIYNNKAIDGGGVYFWTYNGAKDEYDGRAFDAIFENGVNIYSNTATQYGGGIYIGIDASDDVGFKAITSGTWNPETDTAKVLFNVEIQTGATIEGNKAPKGAGIAIRDAAPYRHKNTSQFLVGGNNVPNPAYNQWSGVYRREVNIAGGTVCNNTTTGDEMAGAGIYIEKYEYPAGHTFLQDYNYADAPGTYGAGTLTVNAESGLIYGNKAINDNKPGFGGGMYIASKFTNNTIVSTLNVNIGKTGKTLEMYQNQAYTDGGGVYVLYDRTDSRKNQGTVTVAGGTIGKTNLDTGNKALHGNGGGICVMGGTVFVNGGNIEYNTAGELGGGVYVSVPNNQSTTTIQGGANISNNQAKGGGGVYVDKGKLDVVGNVWNTTTPGWEPLDWPTTDPYAPASETTHTRITKNSATDGNGGGINAGDGEVDITNTLIYKNTASGTGENKGRGGGVYLNQGTINLITSKVLDNTAYLNGGGIDDHFGNISITGGDISNNTATNGGGGGVYTHHGNITVWPDYDIENTTITSQQIETVVMPKGTKVDSNKAGKNGGGLNTHVGRFDVRFATITNNEAGMSYGSTGNGSGTGGNGGGLFCEGPHTDPSGYTVRLLHCHLNDNKVYGNVLLGDDITGRGGGIYLKKGSIFAEHCDILRNEADINGGGLDNHEGELRVYGSYIDHNKAKTGRGGGIYTQMGNIVVGPCDSYGFTASKASRIQNNTAYLNGGGINNHEGNITIHGDRINNNTAETGDGGGVYIKSGQILMYGGQINNNKADQGKGGGVYGGSGRFEIMEREPHPILEILEVENITIDSFIVHFHHVDRGLAMESGATAKEFGIAYSTNPYPNLPANQEWNTTNWPGVTKITFNVANGNSASINTTYPESMYSYVRNEGCSRVTVKGLSAGTYYVVAYGKYSKGTKNYFDASPALKVVIPSSSKAAEGNHPKSIYPAVDENPFFMELTPLQQAMLASTPEGDTTAAPASRAITDRDDPNQEKPVDIPQINENTARYGGGICIDQANGELVFSGTKGEVSAEGKGQINENFASEAGGGIYIGYQTEGENIGPAMMQMMGKCEVNYNHVPASKQGGGIYLDGRLYVGDQASDADNVHGLKVDRNFSSDIDQDTWVSYTWNASLTPANSKLNNVFLPRSEYKYPEHENSNAHDNKISVITLLSDISGYENKDGVEGFDPDEDEPYSCIGFSVLKGFCPVIATAVEFGGDYANVSSPNVSSPDPMENWMYKLMLMSGVGENNTAEKLTGAIFEDSESYVAVHTRHNMAPFLGKFIYLWGCWTHPIVKTDPETIQPMKGSKYSANPSSDPNWKGHYVITNPDQNTDDGKGDPLEWEIYSPEGLAWFTSYVNGLNAFDEATGNNDDDDDHHAWNVNKNPKAKATIMNDLDMSAYLWVPIGSVQKFQNTIGINNNGSNPGSNNGSLFNDSEESVAGYTQGKHKYCGEFDGQGHIIKGLQGLYLTGIKKFGLFGYLTEGAEVKNTFVDKGLFMSDNPEVEYAAGGIAGEMDGGTLTNSEARMNFNSTYSAANTTVGGLVGNMKNGHIHSCMAMPNFTTSTTTTDQYVGGLVGKMAAGTTLKNSFSNVKFLTEPNYKVGGIAGGNEGTIENVYVRYNNETNTPDSYLDNEDHTKKKFYWISANNNALNAIKYCFTPEGKTGGGTGQWYYSNPEASKLRRTYKPVSLSHGKYGFAHKDQEVEKFDNDNTSYIPTTTGLTYKDKKVQFNGLVDALNNWVAENNATNNATVGAPIYTPWTRTMASTINDDYPVLMFNDFNVVGTEDGIYMKYDDNVNDMWKKPNYKSLIPADKTGKDFQGLTSYNNPKAAMYLYKTNGVTAKNTTPVAINVTGNTAVPLHIHENIGITQATVNDELTARVGVTFDNSNGKAYLSLGGEPYDWHMFSSALKAAPLGITYHSGNTDPETGGKSYSIKNDFARLKTEGIIDDDDNSRSRDYMAPPVIEWNTAPGTVGYFPTNTPYGKWGNSGHWPSSGEFSDWTNKQPYSFDFYCFHEPSRHWINFKREGTAEFMDHWHQDIDGSGKHQNLRYENESTLRKGKGYMMGVSKVSILMADGILNNGDFESEEELSNSPYNFNMSGYSEELRGLNLVGNPYQSYLDFNALVSANTGTIHSNTYYLFDADKQRYISYTTSQGDNKEYAPRVIHPHQGFFIKTANNGALSFNNTMRAATGNEFSYFRGQNLNYPLVNLFCYDVDGFYDLTTVEMNRPELGGGEKLKDMRLGNSLLYASVDGTDYQVLFAPEGTSTVAVRFKASQNGVYTMRWETMHGDFQHLHLIDNLAGVDVDCLKQSEYRFEATTTDYLSRFKLVFDVTDVEENADEAESATFAFQMGDELVVNGSGELSVFDVQGRCIASQRLAGTQSSISLPRAASGMYILRLTGDKQVKTQKLIIK